MSAVAGPGRGPTRTTGVRHSDWRGAPSPRTSRGEGWGLPRRSLLAKPGEARASASSLAIVSAVAPTHPDRIFDAIRPLLKLTLPLLLLPALRGEKVGMRGFPPRIRLVVGPPHPALRADLSPHAGRGK